MTDHRSAPGVLDLDALSRASLQDVPYRWAAIPRALREPAAAAMLARFPMGAYWLIDGDDGEKRYAHAARPLVTLGADHPVDISDLDPIWGELACDLLSPGYREWLAGLIGVSLDDALMEASIWRWDAGNRLEAHHLKEKIVTQVFYFSESWEHEWGGSLRILNSADPEDICADLVPIHGSSSVLVRSENSWHAVTKVTAAARQPRRSVIVTWFHPGSTSPVWTVSAGGEVSCAASSVREPTTAVVTAGAEAEECIAELREQLQRANERLAMLEAMARRLSVRLALDGADRLARIIGRIRS